MAPTWKNPPNDPKKLMDEVYNQKKIEGYVIVFEDGDMYKLKTHYYSCAHSISPKSSFLNDRFLLKSICLDVIDDVVSSNSFSSKKRDEIQKFRDEAEMCLKKKAQVLVEHPKEPHELDTKLIDFAKGKEEDEVLILRKFMVDITSDYDYYRPNRSKIIKWLGMKIEVKDYVLRGEKKKDPKDFTEIEEKEDEEEEEEEIEEEEEEISIKRDPVPPKKLIMCEKHKIPLEYCEFKEDWKDCAKLMEEKYPEMHQVIMKQIEIDLEKNKNKQQKEDIKVKHEREKREKKEKKERERLEELQRKEKEKKEKKEKKRLERLERKKEEGTKESTEEKENEEK